MIKQRIFIALPLPETFKQELEMVLEKEVQALNLRWVPRQNWHLTLLAPQYWNEAETNLAIETLRNNRKSKAFSLESEKIILAPPNKEKRMVWLVFKNSVEFFNLQKNIVNALLGKEFNLEINLRQEKILHLTLARFDLRKTGKFKFEEKIFNQSFLADKFELWQSVLKPEGAEYQSLASFELL
ncbi:MAG: RNA 2',3'-cyclic phosphodiesterase [Patescibacteria group bacterium]